jgi:hypothetical protein
LAVRSDSVRENGFEVARPHQEYAKLRTHAAPGSIARFSLKSQYSHNCRWLAHEHVTIPKDLAKSEAQLLLFVSISDALHFSYIRGASDKPRHVKVGIARSR